ncbi:MAG: mechanosensitive ion channel family protein [Clostridiales bacterium]|nr:mechanosensitive ion channel family protein [Clostridiales bacterium]
MDKTKILEMLKEIFTTKLLASIFIVVLAIILYKVIMTVLDKGSKKSSDGLLAKGKNRTYFELAKNIISSLILVVTILILLQVNGVNVSSLLAGVGIAGIVVGLAIQDWLKDIIRGTTILSDDYFSVGDIVKYEGMEGEVLSFGLKTTKIKDIATGNIISIANRRIEQIEVVPNLIFYRIPIPYEVSLPDADKAVEDVIALMKKSELITGVTLRGVAELADSKIEYLCAVGCKAKDKTQARRDCNRAVIEGLAANGISVPYNKLELVGDKE